MKVALIHYWLVTWRGGERVLAEVAKLFPDADIYTHVADRSLCETYLPKRRVIQSGISRLPFAKRWYQRYLFFMPYALEQLDLRGYDLVISFESGPAKGVIVGPDTLHICYCHSPMRYVWDMYHEYRENSGWLTRLLMGPLLHYVRLWDQVSAQRVDHFVANSRFVAKRIDKYYRRTASVIHPPVAVDDFAVSAKRGNYYLMLGQLVAYKRPHLAVEAFNLLGIPLVVVGEGAEIKQLRRIAKPHVSILGHQSWARIREHYAACRGLIFPGTEDFGIVSVEAMASGKPVLAHRSGGALETVIEGVTGLFFDEQSVESLIDGVMRMEQQMKSFDPISIRRHAESFASKHFIQRINDFIHQRLS